jgi:mono/diheme cytochrome c family protein
MSRLFGTAAAAADAVSTARLEHCVAPARACCATLAAPHKGASVRVAGARLAAALLLTATILPSLATADDAAPTRYPAGATAFQANCSVCHGVKGAGTPSLAPPITSYPARYAANPDGRKQLAMTVLNGMFGGIDVEQKHFDFKMPEFTQLDDATLAAVLNFVVFDLDSASADTKPLTAEEIAAERAHPVDGAAVREHRTKLLSALGL